MINNNNNYNKMAKSVKTAFGGEEDEDQPQPVAPVEDPDDEANMSFSQRVTSQLQKLRKRGAPAKQTSNETDDEQDGQKMAGVWIGNPANSKIRPS